MAAAANPQAGPRVYADRSTAVPLDALRAAASGLEGIAYRTPLVPVPPLERLTGVPIALKCEHLQPVGAFKIRGAYTAISRIPAQSRARGVITYSSGNHGQAVAFAAQRLGIRAVVVMPQRAPAIKVAGVRRLGGEVVIAGNSSAERYEKARRLAQEEGLTMVPPFESLDVIAGQGTCGLEILEDHPAVEAILVPVGGGGLIAGIVSAVAALKPEVQVIGVEPEGAPKLARALEAGRPVKLEDTHSLADGLLPLSVGELPFRILAGVVTQSVLVTEDEIVAAVRFLHEEAGLVVEPSGAVTTAALLSRRVRPTGPTVAVLSGGNIDSNLMQQLLASPPDAGQPSSKNSGQIE
jgi:threo-3-hydroxy-L-aspartate ammonia-lyase